MKLDNPFSLEVRLLYLYNYACFDCGRSDRGLELHHIVGRESASAFNSIPLCRDCHGRVGHTREEEQKYIALTFAYLLNEQYAPVDEDWDFLRGRPWIVDSSAVRNFLKLDA